jgi:hypothetical protein
MAPIGEKIRLLIWNIITTARSSEPKEIFMPLPRIEHRLPSIMSSIILTARTTDILTLLQEVKQFRPV